MTGWLAVLAGAVLGIALSGMGFTDYGEVHKMFTFSDLRLLFTFMGGVAFTGALLAIVARRKALKPKPFHPGIIPGGVLFGAGWAVTGACPGAAFAQVGEGKLLALLTLTGVAAGMVTYQHVHRRFFRWDRGACSDD